MTIIVNGVAREVTSGTIEAVLTELGFSDHSVATARNGEFVAATARASTLLSDYDRLEVLAPMQGG